MICSHNRADGLKQALQTLVVQQTGGKFSYEIVIIHTGSPGTAQVIEEIAEQADVPVRGVLESRPGAVLARNRGIDEARGQWLALFDDDQTAEPTWLLGLWEIAHEKEAQNVGGVLHLRLPEGCTREFSRMCRRMLGETVGWTTAQPYTTQEGPGSGNQMIHRSVFEQIGRWDESFTLRGYDSDLYRRMRMANVRSWYTPDAVGYHHIPADRLGDAYFQETSLHNGWHFSKRDRLEKGITAAILRAIARLGQAACLNFPRWVVARLKGDREQTLDARVKLWRAEGYTRSTLYAIAPSVFAQKKFFSRFEFRAEQRSPAAASARQPEGSSGS
ncbi:MAG: glycosyltransferase family 2 protein [Pirellulales bacterium]|nr:glycosyltransferase family 2 protein [Pirellulales bacterium]